MNGIKAIQAVRYQILRTIQDVRIWVLLVFLLFFHMENLNAILQAAVSFGIRVTPFAFVHLENDFIYQMVVMAGVVICFSHAPFEDEGYTCMVTRTGSNAWAAGQILYIFLMGILYVAALQIFSILPLLGHLELKNAWGKLWTTLAKTSSGSAYGQMFQVSDYIITRYTPGRALGITILLETACTIWLGFLIYGLNKLTEKPVGTCLAAFFVLLDICVANDWMYGAYKLSPITLAQLTSFTGYKLRYGVTFTYAVSFYISGILLFTALSVAGNKKQSLWKYMTGTYQRRREAFVAGEKEVIVFRNVSKSFGTQQVLKDVNLTFEKGRIYGLIGRNGSGKTVLLKCICGLLLPTRGEVAVNARVVGRDIDFPDEIGFLIENPGFLPDKSGLNNLKYLASIRSRVGMEEIQNCIRQVGLNPKDRKRTGKYSLGMRQRLGIAQAFMEDPDILILDEPMNGLDHEGAKEMRSLFLKMKEQGKTMILASHSREDVEILCDHVYEIDHGRVNAIR